MRKYRALRTNKHVSSSNICKYKLLGKADILLKSLYCLGKVSRLLQVQELRYRKCILYRKKSKYRKNRAKHDGFCSLYKDQIPRLQILGNKEMFAKSQIWVGGIAYCPASSLEIKLYQ